MAYDRFASRLMAMSDEVWRRHANPWSGWTRVAMFPFWFLAIWSWTWIGWWALLPVFIMGVWTWLNPRMFPPLKSDRAWITQGVLGERIFMNRKNIPIPGNHVAVAHFLSALAFVAMIGSIVGFTTKDFWLALGGWLLFVTFKMWFVDRMAWIYEIMKDATPEYRKWCGTAASTSDTH